MCTRFAPVAVVLLVALSLGGDPALAQGRRDRGQGTQGQRAQGQPRGAEPRSAGRAERANGGGRRDAGQRARREDDGGGRRTARQPPTERQPRAEVQQRVDAQPGVESQPRRNPQLRFDNRSQYGDRNGWDARYSGDRRAVPRPAPYYGNGYRGDAYRYYGARPRAVVPRYPYYGGYLPYPRHTYVVPYGYRPYGYGPGWSFNLYFGRPYAPPFYGNTGYGYYAIDPGLTYGSLRIVDAPHYAQVLVDGYYAGEVDDYDGIFQRLNLEPGSHHIEIVIDENSPPMEFDVQIIPGQTVTIHARF